MKKNQILILNSPDALVLTTKSKEIFYSFYLNKILVTRGLCYQYSNKCSFLSFNLCWCLLVFLLQKCSLSLRMRAGKSHQYLPQVSWRRLTGDRHLRDVKEERKECHTIGRDKIKCELHLPATRRTVQEKVTSTFHVTESYSRAILGN